MSRASLLLNILRPLKFFAFSIRGRRNWKGIENKPLLGQTRLAAPQLSLCLPPSLVTTIPVTGDKKGEIRLIEDCNCKCDYRMP